MVQKDAELEVVVHEHGYRELAARGYGRLPKLGFIASSVSSIFPPD